MSSSGIAVLWDSEVDWQGDKPFNEDYINNSYSVFSNIASRKNSEVVIGNFSWYENERLTKAYCFRDGEWVKVENVEIDGIFDKFKFDNETVDIKKEMHSKLPVLNNFELEEICKDKLKTYRKFPEHVPETRMANKKNVEELLEENGRVVLKPRYDFGGKGVEVIDDLRDYEPRKDLLVQRFVDSSTGINDLGVDGVHDLRVIMVDDKPAASFVRTPDEGFISNVARGGSMHHFEVDEIPEQALNIAKEIDEEFHEMGKRVYAVDFIFDSEGKPWILEMNSKPGLVFYGDEYIRSWKEPLMEEVVKDLVELVN